MPFWECFYHINWTTKHRAPIITPPMKGIIFAAIRQKSDELGCLVLAINGVEDHVHVAVRIVPSVAVSSWVAQVKGASARSINMAQSPEAERFHWQEGYGVLTFGAKTLDLVTRYVERQKEHHRSGSVQAYMEQCEP